jgi:hypothetical protein
MFKRHSAHHAVTKYLSTAIRRSAIEKPIKDLNQNLLAFHLDTARACPAPCTLSGSRAGYCTSQATLSTQPIFSLASSCASTSILLPSHTNTTGEESPAEIALDFASTDPSHFNMAEIFGAVASGAGLVSLSMQLLESSQKLKSFCDTARDASGAVARLSFELETMSLALHQFEHYRQQDIFGSELLTRCITSCEQTVSRILAAVNKIDALLRRSRFAGRVYMGFKDPEVRGLLEEMEHAKSFLQLAYMEYCQYAISQRQSSDIR